MDEPPIWMLCRQEAEDLTARANCLNEKLIAARRDPAVQNLYELEQHAALLNDQARLARELASEVAHLYFNHPYMKTHSVDVHTQREWEAVMVARLFLLYCSRMPAVKNLIIITGHGSEKEGVPVKSDEETGILRKAVAAMLDQEGIVYDNETNIGRFNIVFTDEYRKRNFTFLKDRRSYRPPWSRFI